MTLTMVLFSMLFACGESAEPAAAVPAPVAPVAELTPAIVAPAAAATPAQSVKAIPLVALDGGPLAPSLVDDEVVLFVNVASRCGFTPQYEQLQALHAEYKDRGFTVVGVPCNQFGGQEPGDPAEIATFCEKNYGVNFPILEKQDVNGGARSPLYQALVQSGVGGGTDVQWNFEKFMVDRKGEVIGRWDSRTLPTDAVVVETLRRAL